jgi:hypothetical protein
MSKASARRGFKPTRTFSKRMLIANNLLAWCAIFYSMYLGAGVAGVVAPSMAALLVGAFGVYAGAGHFDMRAIAQVAAAGRDPSMAFGGYGYGGGLATGGLQGADMSIVDSSIPATEPFVPGQGR